MEGGLAVCPTDFFNINKNRKLHFKSKCLPKQRFERCRFSIALVFNKLLFLCNGTDIIDHLVTVGQSVAQSISLIHQSC